MGIRRLADRTRAGLLSLLLVLPVCAIAESGDGGVGDLTVIPVGLESSSGSVFAQLQRDAAAFEGEGESFRDADVKVVDARAVLVFADLPHGDYALKIFHDENDNRKLDTNFVGMPREKFGFSNDAMGRFGPPSFEQARFRFDEPAKTLRIEMK